MWHKTTLAALLVSGLLLVSGWVIPEDLPDGLYHIEIKDEDDHSNALVKRSGPTFIGSVPQPHLKPHERKLPYQPKPALPMNLHPVHPDQEPKIPLKVTGWDCHWRQPKMIRHDYYDARENLFDYCRQWRVPRETVHIAVSKSGNVAAYVCNPAGRSKACHEEEFKWLEYHYLDIRCGQLTPGWVNIMNRQWYGRGYLGDDICPSRRHGVRRFNRQTWVGRIPSAKNETENWPEWYESANEHAKQMEEARTRKEELEMFDGPPPPPPIEDSYIPGPQDWKSEEYETADVEPNWSPGQPGYPETGVGGDWLEHQGNLASKDEVDAKRKKFEEKKQEQDRIEHDIVMERVRETEERNRKDEEERLRREMEEEEEAEAEAEEGEDKEKKEKEKKEKEKEKEKEEKEWKEKEEKVREKKKKKNNMGRVKFVDVEYEEKEKKKEEKKKKEEMKKSKDKKKKKEKKKKGDDDNKSKTRFSKDFQKIVDKEEEIKAQEKANKAQAKKIEKQEKELSKNKEKLQKEQEKTKKEKEKNIKNKEKQLKEEAEDLEKLKQTMHEEEVAQHWEEIEALDRE